MAQPTPHKFHHDDSRVRGLMGPIGSGKSAACTLESMFRSYDQEPAPDNIRYSRGVVIRNSYRELQDTTIQTFFDWIPEESGIWTKSDMLWTFAQGDLCIEVLFRALDKVADIKKLLSLELTWGWINEAREVPLAVVQMLDGRIGRYPSMRVGGPTWHGLWMDTNPPDDDHWWYRMFEEERPKGWSLHRQPGGLSKDAENLENLVPGYYENMQAGKSEEWVKVYIDGNYGYVQEHKPVYPEYKDSLHTLPEEVEWDPEKTLYVGVDFGLTPAALFAQKDATGQWTVIDELVTDSMETMGATRFAKKLRRKLQDDFPNADLRITGDPAGDQRSQVDERTPFMVLSANGINASPATTNDFTVRRDAVANLLLELTIMGKPALVVSPRAKTFRKGMNGKYYMRRVQVPGEERFKDEPEKTQHSHVCEAGQYCILGGGGGDAVLGQQDWNDGLDDFDWNRRTI